MLRRSFNFLQRKRTCYIQCRLSSSGRPSLAHKAGRNTWSAVAAVGIEIDFKNTKLAFKSKTNLELWRAYLVFKLFQYNAIVDRSQQIINFLKGFLRKDFFSKLMKATVFDQFIAGENVNDLQFVLSKLKSQGVGPILAYSAEENHLMQKQGSDFEKSLDDNLRYSINCINTVADTCDMKYPFSATKITGFAKTTFLLKLSEVLVGSERMFKCLANQHNTHVTKDTLMKGVHQLNIELTHKEIDTICANFKIDKINFFDWNNKLIFSNNPQINTVILKKLNIPILSDDDKQHMQKVMKRLEILSDVAQKRGVRLMIDAEQSYYQPAIRHIAVHHLMPKYNMEYPVIYNTQQCYLRNGLQQVQEDIAASEHYGCHFGVKAVRGAYIEAETKLAQENGYNNPTWSIKSDTDCHYHQVLDTLMEKVRGGKVHVMVATHNEDTIKFAINKMHMLRLNTNDGSVVFGQLYGMSDHLSLTLGSHGYMVYKYMLYGSIDEVIPYLIRRANENRGMLAGAVKERSIVLSEIKRRLSNSWTSSYFTQTFI